MNCPWEQQTNETGVLIQVQANFNFLVKIYFHFAEFEKKNKSYQGTETT